MEKCGRKEGWVLRARRPDRAPFPTSSRRRPRPPCAPSHPSSASRCSAAPVDDETKTCTLRYSTHVITAGPVSRPLVRPSVRPSGWRDIARSHTPCHLGGWKSRWGVRAGHGRAKKKGRENRIHLQNGEGAGGEACASQAPCALSSGGGGGGGAALFPEPDRRSRGHN